MRRPQKLLIVLAVIVLGSFIYVHFHDDGWRPFPGGGEIRALTVTYGREIHVETGSPIVARLRTWLGPRWDRFLGEKPEVAIVTFSKGGVAVWFVTRHVSTYQDQGQLFRGVQETLVVGDREVSGTNFFTADNGGGQLLIGAMFDDVARTQPRLHIRWSKDSQITDFSIENPFFPPTKPIDSEEKTPPPPVGQPSASMPYGQPVPGKPGYVTSPFAPASGYVDVRGFPSGTQVRCPYTQNLFLVP